MAIRQVMDGWTELNHAAAWSGTDPEVLRGFAAELGDEDLQELQILAALPVSVLKAAHCNAAFFQLVAAVPQA